MRVLINSYFTSTGRKNNKNMRVLGLGQRRKKEEHNCNVLGHASLLRSLSVYPSSRYMGRARYATLNLVWPSRACVGIWSTLSPPGLVLLVLSLTRVGVILLGCANIPSSSSDCLTPSRHHGKPLPQRFHVLPRHKGCQRRGPLDEYLHDR